MVLVIEFSNLVSKQVNAKRNEELQRDVRNKKKREEIEEIWGKERRYKEMQRDMVLTHRGGVVKGTVCLTSGLPSGRKCPVSRVSHPLSRRCTLHHRCHSPASFARY
jgi:hypothetical protein